MPSLEDLTPDARDELAALARELAENPTTRKDLLRLTKRIKPNVPIPELEIEEATNTALSASEQRIAQLEARLREKEALEDLNKRREALMRKGLAQNDEEVEQVEKVMLEKGITSHETAAEYVRWMREAAPSTPPTSFNRNFMDDQARTALSSFWKNPQTAARNEAAKAMQELRGKPRPIGI